MTAKLSVQHVSKSFRTPAGPLPVLVDQSLEVRDREFVALLGPSGCGKSTLLRIIDGLVRPDAGRVLLDGRDITGQTGGGKAMVFQSFDLLPWRTVIDNIAFGLELRGVERTERHERARRLIGAMGLEGFERSYPFQLSGGMQQRVGIARALAIEPEVLLMDEPFGALDVLTREMLQDELLTIWQRERKTVVFVTHGIEEALYLADRIVLFGSRPTRIRSIIDVPFPRPRSEETRWLPEFSRLRREIKATMKQPQDAT
jgi:NitT/TauT family transport system ATP-binding protein